jgi:hypothetical protein
MRKADVDEVCRLFPELSTALQEVANLRSRQFLVKTSNPLKGGDYVKIVKEGSSLFGSKARVVDPNWNGMVKVTLIGETAFKTYKPNQLELDVSILQKFKRDDMVKIIKSGSKMGRVARVEDPKWNELVKVVLVGEAVFKSYNRHELELATDDEVAAAQAALSAPDTVEEPTVSSAHGLPTTVGKTGLPVHSPSPVVVDQKHLDSMPLSPLSSPFVRGAAKKWLTQIKEKEILEEEIELTSFTQEEGGATIDTSQSETNRAINEIPVARLPAETSSERVSIIPPYVVAAQQEAEVTICFFIYL